MSNKQLKSFMQKSKEHDLYHDKYGDNYLIKNDWRLTRQRHERHYGNSWKINELWDKSAKDLNIHDGIHYKSFYQYEQKTNPNYVRDKSYKIYKYDNPLVGGKDKYNSTGFEATSRGYAKSENSTTISINRKRKNIY